MDMASAKSDVIGPKKTCVFGQFELENDKKKKKKYFKKYRPSLYWTSQGFLYFLKRLDYIKSDLNLKSSLLMLDFSGRLSVQYTLNTLYVTPTYKK